MPSYSRDVNPFVRVDGFLQADPEEFQSLGDEICAWLDNNPQGKADIVITK